MVEWRLPKYDGVLTNAIIAEALACGVCDGSGRTSEIPKVDPSWSDRCGACHGTGLEGVVSWCSYHDLTWQEHNSDHRCQGATLVLVVPLEAQDD